MNKPGRPCKKAGCNRIVSGGWCDEHRPAQKRVRSAQWHSMYGTRQWAQLRQAQLLREPLCRMCAASGIRTKATDVDHIVDHKGDAVLFSSPSNLESLCHRCHSRKTMLENGSEIRRR